MNTGYMPQLMVMAGGKAVINNGLQMKCLKCLLVSGINLNNCSYNEWMILNAETRHTSPRDYLYAAAIRDMSGTDSCFDATNYMAFAKEVMNDMKAMSSWAFYLSYDKWIQSILSYTSKMKEQK